MNCTNGYSTHSKKSCSAWQQMLILFPKDHLNLSATLALLFFLFILWIGIKEG